MKCASRGQNQIYSGFAEAEYLRHSQSTIFFCQSAAGGGCVGRLWRDDAALRMGRLRAAALRVLTEERIFRIVFWQTSDLRDRTAKIAEAVTAAARAPGAGVQNSAVFCARSASAGGGTRYFSPCLIFWCFWIKPKAQKKSEIDSLFLWESSVPLIGCFLRGADLPPFVTKRWRQKCPQGEKLGDRPTACA